MKSHPGDRVQDWGADEYRRLFFALWPGRRVREELHRIARGIAPAGARLVRKENLHLTLAFAGRVGPRAADCLCRAASRLRIRPFDLLLDQSGWFPRSRVQWLAPAETPPELVLLAGRLNQALDHCGLTMETRPFRAHLSIARKLDGHPPPPARFLPPAWHVDRFTLVESTLLPGGVRYRPVAEWPLRRSG
jgi:2'-5' RNA ligase